MSDDINPYLAPLSDASTAVATGDYYVLGRDLICRSGAVLPQRCIISNEPIRSDRMKTKTLSWATPWIYLLLLVNLLILIIVYFCVRKRVTVTFGMSVEAQAQRTKKVALFWLLVLVSAASIALAFVSDDLAIVGVFGMLLLCGSLIYLVILGSVLRPTKLLPTGEFALRGCGDPFLFALERETKGLPEKEYVAPPKARAPDAADY